MNGVTDAPIISCIAWVLRASTDIATDTPIAAPRLRSRLNSAAPSVRIDGASVTNASTWIGVNNSPIAAPWMMIATMISCWDTSGVQRVISQYGS